MFDIFYSKRMVVRSGGGTSKKKMCRNEISSDEIAASEMSLKSNPKLYKYFNKLKNRSGKIAPPPRPTQRNQ